jgi:DNA-binding NarL/FixJ family response regulator
MDSKHTVPDGRNRRILIVDDHPLVRVGLSSLIEAEADLVVCGETGKMREAVDLVRTANPDLVIVDLSLADGNGLDLVKRLAAQHDKLRILVCSMHDESLFAHRVLGAGARGYVNKQEAARHIVSAIRHLLNGKIWLSEPMMERVLDGIAKGRSASTSTSATVENLSDRELEVFGLIGEGMGPSQIAELLHLSVKTIETHKQKIKTKLNLKSGSELTRRAMQWMIEQA